MVTRRQFLTWGVVAAAATACDARARPRSEATQAAPNAGGTLIENVGVFDGMRHLGTNGVLIRGDLIEAVGQGLDPDDVHERVDGTGCTLLPGLIDSHTHVFSAHQLGLDLLFGVTTELDMFTDPGLAADLRGHSMPDRADLRSAGYLATTPGGHGTHFALQPPTLEAPEEADQWVAERISEGSDYIKLVVSHFADTTLDQPAVAALAEAARRRAVLTIAHVETRAHAQEVIEAGVDGLAHVFADEPADGRLLDLAAERDTFLITTSSLYNAGREVALAGDERMRSWLTDSALRHIRRRPPFPRTAGRARLVSGVIRQFHEANLRVLAGTDTPVAPILNGFSMHSELELLVDAGLEPAAALAAATSTPAETFRLHDRGRIEPGRRADLLLVEGDPTQDITATRSVKAIWKQGHSVDRHALLEQLRREDEEYTDS